MPALKGKPLDSRAHSLDLFVAVMLFLPVLAASIGLGAALIVSELPDELQRAPAPVTLHATAVTTDYAQKVSVGLLWPTEAAVFAPAWSGLVQEVYVVSGDPVVSGQAIVMVSDRVYLGFATDRPIVNTIRLGDTGSEVRLLGEALERVGLIPDRAEPWNVATSDLMTAVEGLYQRSGRSGGEFDPSDFIWLPSDSGTYAELDLSPGGPAPADGTAIGSIQPDIESVTILDNETAASIARSSPGSDIVLDINGVVVSLVETPDGWSTDNAGRRSLTRVVGSQTSELSGVARLRDTTVALAIPAAALLVSQSGEACVLVEKAGVRLPVQVDVGPAANGVVHITNGLAPEDSIVIPPPNDTARFECDG